MTPLEIELAIELAIKAQQALNEFLTNGLPVLQKAGIVIQHMQASGLSIPGLADRADLKAEGAKVDAAAEAAIKGSPV